VLTDGRYAPKVKSSEDEGRFTLRNISAVYRQEEQWTNKGMPFVTQESKPTRECYPQYGELMLSF
jgi:hypothetical protein